VLDHQLAGQDERGDLGIAEPLEQAPDVAIDRLFPHAPAAIEISAHEHAIDAGVDRSSIEGDQATFGIANDADLRVLAAARAESIHGREHLLDFEADRMAAHVKGLPVDPLPPGLLTLPQLRIIRLNEFAPDEGWNDEFAAALSQDASELTLRRQAGCEAEDLFGSLAGVRHGDERRGTRAAHGFDQQPFGSQAVEHRPPDLEHPVAACFRNQRWILVVSVALERRRNTWIDCADDLAQAIAIVFERRLPGGRRGAVVSPELPRPCLHLADLAFDETMGPVHQPAGQVLFGPFERGRLRQRSSRRDLAVRRVRAGPPSERQHRGQNEERDSRRDGSQGSRFYRSREVPGCLAPGTPEPWNP
jgi:hypothetical protein